MHESVTRCYGTVAWVEVLVWYAIKAHFCQKQMLPAFAMQQMQWHWAERTQWWIMHHSLITWVVRVVVLLRYVWPLPISLELGGVRDLRDPLRITFCWEGMSCSTFFWSSLASSDTWGSIVSDEPWLFWPGLEGSHVLRSPSLSATVGDLSLPSRVENLKRQTNYNDITLIMEHNYPSISSYSFSLHPKNIQNTVKYSE